MRLSQLKERAMSKTAFAPRTKTNLEHPHCIAAA
jgi:hypothetical protein